MASLVVKPAPQNLVLGHGQNHTTTRLDGLAEPAENVDVVIDMLKHIKRSNDVELILVGDTLGIGMKQVDVAAQKRTYPGK